MIGEESALLFLSEKSPNVVLDSWVLVVDSWDSVVISWEIVMEAGVAMVWTMLMASWFYL